MTKGSAERLEGSGRAVPVPDRVITIAVAGNPNSGKSTLINAIAGSRLHVGNWPGVTVEKKSAVFRYEGAEVNLVDLPGTYSLSPYSEEEITARDYLVREKPDVIIDVVDATNLERNLYLTVQLMELGIPMVLALNIYDEALKKGYEINVKAMEELLGMRVVSTVATKKTGLDDLIRAALDAARDPRRHAPKRLVYSRDIESAAVAVENEIESTPLAKEYPVRWLALKLIEGDGRVSEETALFRKALHIDKAASHLKLAHDSDVESLIADARYAQASGLTWEVLKKTGARKRELTERIDGVVLNRFFGIPIFLVAMWFVFKLTFDLSKPFADWMSSLASGPFKAWTEALVSLIGGRPWMVSLAGDGIIAGVGSVVVFIPVIFAMMFFITFLEGSGYMARAAFVMDRVMHAVGLHGKSFIPMLLGFGCNVPAIYVTRTLENPRDKALTALLVPLMSCGARLPVYVIFTGAFFPDHAGLVLWSLYVMGIVLAIFMGVFFKKTLFRGEPPMFIMELPPYRMPSFASLGVHTWEKGKHFIIKAGTYILAVSVIMWFLLNLPWGVEEKKDSWLGHAGRAVAPLLQPAGFGTWESGAALISGVIAKEIVVGTMAEIYSVKGRDEEKRPQSFAQDLAQIGTSFLAAAKEAAANVFSTFGAASIAPKESADKAGLQTVLQKTFTPLSAYSFIAFVLLYMPCVVVAVAMRHEFGTWKWFLIAFAYQMALAWCVAVLIYQGGRLFGSGG